MNLSKDVPMKQILTSGASCSRTILSAAFYETSMDFPQESFAKIAKRLLPGGFGRSKTGAALKQEAQRMYNLAR